MITLKRLTELGWERKNFYAPGSSKATGYEYLYEKSKKQIRVNEATLEIRTYDGSEHKMIETEQQLQDYDFAGTIH